MATFKCPQCGGELKEQGTRYTCPDCGITWKPRFTCRECGNEPEMLASCGSVGYLCNTCNRPRSRSAMDVEFIPE